jgi:uncharacterized protein (DUF924 family)
MYESDELARRVADAAVRAGHDRAVELREMRPEEQRFLDQGGFSG